jgi:hypothetical protein
MFGGLRGDSMGKRYVLAAVCAACFHAYPSTAPARFVKKWEYDDLLKEADLVVLAVAVRTEQADDKPPDHSWPLEFVAQNSTLKVRCALKGKAEGEHIKVFHFKFEEPKKGLEDRAIINGPNFVAFRTRPAPVKLGKDKQFFPAPEYLLFLKHMKDGRYEPVSGQIDPDRSVRQVSGPSGVEF